MKDAVIQLITALLGGIGFGLLFGMHRRHILPAALGGVLAWAIYLGIVKLSGTEFLACLVAASVAVFYGETLARLRKAPATQFVMGGIVPLVPGSSLYRAMSCVVRGEMEAAREYGSATLLAALAIAGGISIVLALRELQTKKQ